MIRVPLAVVPYQTLAVTLGGQACEIVVRQNGVNMYFDLKRNQQSIALCRIIRNKQLLLLDSRYRQFSGDFMFWDSQGDTQPFYTGLNSRYWLYYISAAELP